jgi:fructokinase
MPDVACLGELLIDFTSLQPGASIIETPGFEKHAGGGPANVAVAVSRLGGEAAFLGMVGDDEFGRYLAKILADRGVEIGGLCFTRHAHTTLAFVALRADGEREFIFYRNPGADMLYGPADLDESLLRATRVLHHGSISLISPENRAATLRAVAIVKAAGGLVSYDPNIRLNLWESADAAHAGIALGLPTADLLKCSEEEVAFLTGETDLWRGIAVLRSQEIPAVVVTRGAAGCVYSWAGHTGSVPGKAVEQVDATGAGDAFIGALLYRLTRHAPVTLELEQAEIEGHLAFANAVAARVVTRRGAIPAMPTLAEI